MVIVIGVLKKLAIHGGINTISERVKTPITLLMSPITNKDTFDSAGFKFVSIVFG